MTSIINVEKHLHRHLKKALVFMLPHHAGIRHNASGHVPVARVISPSSLNVFVVVGNEHTVRVAIHKARGLRFISRQFGQVQQFLS